MAETVYGKNAADAMINMCAFGPQGFFFFLAYMLSRIAPGTANSHTNAIMIP
ncbi:hypothetical protein BD408DRAFT_277762 [Parasitella parasitica]|nr:hypothetical protein BD408DRAFT_277762 [Parasitella parasitica]